MHFSRASGTTTAIMIMMMLMYGDGSDLTRGRELEVIYAPTHVMRRRQCGIKTLAAGDK